MNVVGYRLLHNQSFIYPRSYCPHCRKTLLWYDMIPLLSYIMLKGKCRFCSGSISWLYPTIELITYISLGLLFYLTPSAYWLAYCIFFSALIVTIRTDLDKMLISRYVTLYLVPVGWLFSYGEFLPITLWESVIGSLFGYGILLLIAKTFTWLRKKEGIGQGDLDLLAFIGSFLGPWGCWFSLFIASIIGSAVGITLLIRAQKLKSIQLPFGPFLAVAAIFYTLFSSFLFEYLF